ncbi:ScbA/BarX family gamma-butyrolactone biosynthesis protein [Streptomyces sp. NPDC037389]|uniref:ScbA/BarX family gamma-butyrolactone biosynthesis protein n=1 Tax=Streptomyces sp. NPDC037389 TaxID=3155369 RepID=UPI003401873F
MSVTVQQSCTLEPGIPKSAGASEAATVPSPRSPAEQAVEPRGEPAAGPVVLPDRKRIAKELVHLHDEASVLVVDWVRRGPAEFTLTVEWPASASGDRPDPELAAHTLRQCGLAISHAEFGVPLDHQSLLRNLDFSIAPTARPEGNDPLLLSVDLRCSPENGRDARGHGCEAMDFTVRAGARTIISARSLATWISPGVYRRLRGAHLSPRWGDWEIPAPVAPSAVGRSGAGEVVLAATDAPDRWLLRNDPDNKEMFDHPVDHVPGLGLFTAACQAARAARTAASAGDLPAGTVDVTMAYSRYVEFDAPCFLETAPLETASVAEGVEVTGVQEGEVAFRIGLRHGAGSVTG